MKPIDQQALMQQIDELLGHEMDFTLLIHDRKTGGVAAAGNVSRQNMILLCRHVLENEILGEATYPVPARGIS